MTTLKMEIWMAKVDTMRDMMTVVSEWEMSVGMTNKKSKWMRY
jgi:hypothetical protein